LLFTKKFYYLKEIGYVYFRDIPDNSESGKHQTKKEALKQLRYVEQGLQCVYARYGNFTYVRVRRFGSINIESSQSSQLPGFGFWLPASMESDLRLPPPKQPHAAHPNLPAASAPRPEIRRSHHRSPVRACDDLRRVIPMSRSSSLIARRSTARASFSWPSWQR
jgi:hypothetical protein